MVFPVRPSEFRNEMEKFVPRPDVGIKKPVFLGTRSCVANSERRAYVLYNT